MPGVRQGIVPSSMDEILRKQRERRMKTPALLVPEAAMSGEDTYGYYPSARDIKHAERRKDVKRGKASNKVLSGCALTN